MLHLASICLDAHGATHWQEPRGGGGEDRGLPRDDAHGRKRRARRARRPQGRRPDPQPHQVRHPRLGCHEARSPRAIRSVGRPAQGGFQRERLDRALACASDAPLREGNRLELLRNGPDTYDDWLTAISGAKRWVHLDNYIFSDDEVGERFAKALIQKAEEGVSVRVLYDWFGCLDVRRSFWQRMREAGVEVRAVNPPTLGGPLGAIRRDHRKLLAIDGEYASTGGVCISDGWLVTAPETGLPYRDTAVGVRGPAVAEVERAFAGLWSVAGGSLSEDELPDPGSIPQAGAEAARVVVQEPRRMRTLRMLQLLTAGVERRLWITDAYFLSMAILSQSLMSVARDGVDVAGSRTCDQRSALDRGALPHGLPAIPRGGGAFLRVRRTYDPRQDPRRRRLVVEGRLDEPERRQPRRELGDRSGGRGHRLRRPDGRAFRGGSLQRPRGPPRRVCHAPQGASGAPDPVLRPRCSQGRRGERFWRIGHHLACRQHGTPEERLSAGDPRTGSGSCGQRCLARSLSSQPPFPALLRLAPGRGRRPLRRPRGAARRPLDLI